GTRLPRPADTGTRLPRPADTGTRLPRPADTGTRLPHPANTDTRLPRPADAENGTRLPRPAETGTRLPRPADTGTRLPRPADTDTRLPRPADTGTRISHRSRPEPAAAGSAPVTPRPLTTPPVAPEPVMPPPLAPRPMAPPPVAPAAASGRPTGAPVQPGNRPVSVPPPPPGMTPIVPGSRPSSPAAEFRPTISDAAMSKARAERQRTVIPPRPSARNGTPASTGATDYSLPLPEHRDDAPAVPPGSRANWPLLNSNDDSATRPAPTTNTPSDGRVRPPWQDMPSEPPPLRLVESQLNGFDSAPGDAASTEPPPLRLVDPSAAGRAGRAGRRNTLTALDRSTQPPVPAEGDGDLLIFAAARSAWFTGHDDAPTEMEWSSPLDTGWQAAEKAASPEVAAETSAGLPKRVPQANLVPGSPLRDEHPLRIVRDAASIAAHTTGYFRGWRRGQEIGGYAIGGRPGRESAGGWDFSRDGQGDDYRNNTGYQSN
ncbi:MAG TPA: transposase, partial [Actinoplanes sp.]|nr:transposase [Actinoplanes sp.]